MHFTQISWFFHTSHTTLAFTICDHLARLKSRINKQNHRVSFTIISTLFFFAASTTHFHNRNSTQLNCSRPWSEHLASHQIKYEILFPSKRYTFPRSSKQNVFHSEKISYFFYSHCYCRSDDYILRTKFIWKSSRIIYSTQTYYTKEPRWAHNREIKMPKNELVCGLLSSLFGKTARTALIITFHQQDARPQHTTVSPLSSQ